MSSFPFLSLPVHTYSLYKSLLSSAVLPGALCEDPRSHSQVAELAGLHALTVQLAAQAKQLANELIPQPFTHMSCALSHTPLIFIIYVGYLYLLSFLPL